MKSEMHSFSFVRGLYHLSFIIAVRYKDLLDDPYTDLSNLFKSNRNACSIIYCLERASCDDLSAYLSKNGISSAGKSLGFKMLKFNVGLYRTVYKH